MGPGISRRVASATPDWIKEDVQQLHVKMQCDIMQLSNKTSFFKQLAILSYPAVCDSLRNLNAILKTCCMGSKEEVMFGLRDEINAQSYLWKVHIRIICFKVNREERTVKALRMMNLNQYWKVRTAILNQVVLYNSIHKPKSNQQDFVFVQHDDCSDMDNNAQHASTSQQQQQQETKPSFVDKHHTLTASAIIERVDELQERRANLEECMICMENNNEVSLKCAHSFCETCIMQWTQDTKTCPVCRDLIYTTDEFWEISDVPTIGQINKNVLVIATGM